MKRGLWKSFFENPKWLGLSIIAFVFVVAGAVAQAQQAGKSLSHRFLDNSTASGIAVLSVAFRQELSKIGWIEGKNISVEYRFAEGKFDRLPDLAADLVRLKVDLIMASGGNRHWRPRLPLRLSPL
jgi:putative ABC transport system substrate-binding protein